MKSSQFNRYGVSLYMGLICVRCGSDHLVYVWMNV